MYDELLERTKGAIQSVRSVLKTNEQLRALVFAEEAGEVQDLKQKVLAYIGTPPDPTLWRVHDHCAAVTRLYGIYERFVVEIVGDWLVLLPKLVANYQSLADSVHKEHRRGVARVLQNLGSTKFRHLTALDAVRGFHQAVSGAESYELLPEAFALRDQNYRPEILQDIFNSVAVMESWAWIQSHRQVKGYVEKIGADSTKAENELKQFVQDRNDAAHGVVDEVLSVTRIIEISELVEALCVAICEMLSWQVVSRKETNGAASTVGDVTENFTSGAVVAKMQNVEFQLGDRFYVCGASCCYPAVVKSIQLNDVDQEWMAVTTETEVGLMFDREVKKNRKLYRIS